ncbi:hypothetical protein [Mycobacterium sp.]
MAAIDFNIYTVNFLPTRSATGDNTAASSMSTREQFGTATRGALID